MLRILLLAAVLLALCRADDPSDPSFLLNRIYTTYTEGTESPCVRLLNYTSHIGCGEAFPVRAPILDLTTTKEFLTFIETADAETSVVLISAASFTEEKVNQLVATKRVAGILVAYSSEAPTPSWSPADQNPNQIDGLRPTQFFAWNPEGTSWSFAAQQVPIFWLSNDTSAQILAVARSQSATYPKWVAEFNTEMWATQNSKLCLDRGFCLPVGGQSPWATLGPLDARKEVVMVVAGLDTSAFFHGNAKGAVSSASGVAALLGAFIALGEIPDESIAAWQHQVVFAFFQGEAWGYVGSKRFVMETQSFVCRSGEWENGCADPFKNSLAFTKVKFEKIRYLIEAKQVGSKQSAGLYLHTEKPVNPNTITLLRAVNETKVPAYRANNGNPGIPPSSSHSFLLANKDIGSVVIADHAGAYVNPFYDSDFDQLSNVNTDLVCSAAQLIAGTVSVIVGQEAVEVNCTLVAALVACLSSNLSCDAALNWTGYKFPIPFSNYVGVFQWTNSWTMPTDFVWRILNATKPQNGTTNLHDALSPAFEYDENTGYWKIVDTTQSTWTESYWNVLTLRIFLQESWAADVTVLLGGIASTAAFSALLVYMRKTLGFVELSAAR